MALSLNFELKPNMALSLNFELKPNMALSLNFELKPKNRHNSMKILYRVLPQIPKIEREKNSGNSNKK
jgi:hypothetical protein